MGAGCGKLEGHWKNYVPQELHFVPFWNHQGKTEGCKPWTRMQPQAGGVQLLRSCCSSGSAEGILEIRFVGVPQNGHPTPPDKAHLPGRCREAGNSSSISECVAHSQSAWNSRNPKITQTKINLFLRPCLDYEKMGSVPHCQGWRGCGQLGTFDYVCGWTVQNWNHFAEPAFAENITLTLAVALLGRQCQPAKCKKWGFVKLLVLSCSNLDCSWRKKPQPSHDEHMAEPKHGRSFPQRRWQA